MPTYKNAAFIPPTIIPTNLENNDSFILKVKPDKGFKWTDNTSGDKSIKYFVTGLKTTSVHKPTMQNIARATGTAGSGTYKPKDFTGTTVEVSKTSNLKNGDTIEITYKLREGYKWEDNTRSDVTLNLIVSGLQKIDIRSGDIEHDLKSISKITGPKYTGAEVYTKVRGIISNFSMYTVGEIEESSTIEISVRQSSSVPVPDSKAKISADFFSISVNITSANKNINQLSVTVTNIQNGTKS